MLRNLIVFFCIAVLTSCGSFDGAFMGANSDPVTENTNLDATDEELMEEIFNQINDIPFPKKAKLDILNSLIMGADEDWFGQLIFIAEESHSEAFAYWKEHMPDTGWFLIMEQQSKQDFLVYEKDNRVAIININPSKKGSTAVMAVGPRSGLN